jgi:Lysyl oxidase
MARAWNVAGGTATAVAAAALVVGLVAGTPAYSSPSIVGGPTGTPMPTDTATPTPTPTDTATPTPTTTVPPADDLLRPDLVALRAQNLTIQVRSRNDRRLRFSSSLGNIGLGPIEVRPNQNQPCPAGQHNSTQIIYRDANANAEFNPKGDIALSRHRAGCMVFHPFHDHWHFKASARYTLLKPGAADPVVVSARRKVSFCLRDTARVPEWMGSWDYPLSYGSCSRHSPQGISVGWMDVYQSFLAGQYLPLPKKLEDGVYCLHTVVDPLDQLVETNNDNNSSMRELAIRGNRAKLRPISLCR